MTQEATPTVRLLLVDDHEVVRRGVRSVLESEPGFEVVGEASSVEDAIDAVDSLTPDVVVMDIRLGGGSGIEATREIRSRQPGTRVVMLTSHSDQDAVFASILAGAAGYLLKDVATVDLVRSIRTVSTGQSLLDPAVTAAVLERLRSNRHLMRDEKLAQLTSQEERILALIAEGFTNSEIGDELHMAPKTVKNYVTSILAKLDVANRAEAAAYMVKHRTPEV